MIRRVLLVLACGIVLVAPLGEGGRAPLVLFTLHLIAIAFIVVAWAGPGALRPPLAGGPSHPGSVTLALAAAGLALAFVSALRASYPLAAALGMWDLLVPFGLFAASLRAGGDRRDLERLRRIVVFFTTTQAALAVPRYFAGGVVAVGALFQNRNHLAAFLNLGLFLALTQACAPPATRGARALWGGVAAFHGVVLFMQESRGALVALFVSLAVLGARHFRSWTWRARTTAIGILLVCAVLSGLVLGSRFSRSVDPYRFSRLSIWRATAKMIVERPCFGFGPGMYPHVAPRFNFPTDVGPVRYGRFFQGAHSAVLTLAAETGVPAAAAILAALLGVTVVLLRTRPREEALEFGIGLAFLALLVQGIVEDLQARPALTIVPALLAGAAVAVRGTRSGRQAESGVDAGRNAGWRSWTLPARLVGAVVVAYLFVGVVLLPYWADREAKQALQMGSSGLSHMEQAALLNPLHPDYRNDLAMAILNSGPLSSSGYARASDDLLEARRLKPIDYRFPLHLARLESRFAPRLFDDPRGAERAVDFYREAAFLAPLDPRPRLELAGHLVGMGRQSEALTILREALRLEPSFLRGWILEASILLDLGRTEEARNALRQADRTISSLVDYVPDSDYAREIVMDARTERERLSTLLGAEKGSTGPS